MVICTMCVIFLRAFALCPLPFFFFFFHPIYYPRTTLALPPTSDADPGSHSGPSFPLSTTVRVFFFISREQFSFFFPSWLASNCTLGTIFPHLASSAGLSYVVGSNDRLFLERVLQKTILHPHNSRVGPLLVPRTVHCSGTRKSSQAMLAVV